MKIKNPILKGFHPDPSIIRVGDDYYIATSTFEWWPGVRLHHSKDLVNWELIAYPLDRVSQLDLKGVGPSQGIWAPCLTYYQGTFFLVYTVVSTFYCNMHDTNNYLVTATDINGPWSEPITLSNFGFDPSLFHDDDGRKYMVSMVTDHRVPQKYSARLLLQEYDHKLKKMVGPIKDIYAADKIYLEGAHIYKRNDWYYLFSADSGTAENHGQSILRSRDIWGEYEMYKPDFMERKSEDEAYSIMTSRHKPDILLQKSGHADLVETQNGEWYLVHLCGRVLKYNEKAKDSDEAKERRYQLGRETAIQKVVWTDDGWLKLAQGGTTALDEVEMPDLPLHPTAPPLVRDDFDSDVLNLEYQSLRIPMDESYLSLSARPGYLRLFGRSGLSSRLSQTLIARRWTEFKFTATTVLDYNPEVFKQLAGLIFIYDTENYLYLHITHDEDLGKCISIIRSINGSWDYPEKFIPLESDKEVILQGKVDHGLIQFYYGYEEDKLQSIGPEMDCSFISDEACKEGWFTGAMVGLCSQDMTGDRKPADFDWFEYKVD